MSDRVRRSLLAAAIFLAIFGVYLATLNPVFHADDSPETSACAYTLGIQHPPGYPLPTLLGKIATLLLPFGNPGFRVNVMAAACGAATCATLFIIILAMLRRRGAAAPVAYALAVVFSLALGFGPTLWSQSLSAKGGIYALNALLFTLLAYIIFRWEERFSKNWFYLFCLVYGLSLGNHWESMAVVSPAFLVFIFYTCITKGVVRSKNLLWMAAGSLLAGALLFIFSKHNPAALALAAAAFLFFILHNHTWNVKRSPAFVLYSALFFISGTLVYLFLVIRANHGAVINWGDPADIKQLLWVVFRAEYTDIEINRQIMMNIRQAGRWATLIFNELTVASLALAGLGFFAAVRGEKKGPLLFFGSAFAMISAGVIGYFTLKEEMIWIMDVFMIPAYVSLAALSAAGAYFALEKLKNTGTQAGVAAALLALPGFMIFNNYNTADQSRHYFGYDYGMNMAKSVGFDEKAILFIEGDFAVLPQYYLKYVEKKVSYCPVTTLFISQYWGLKNLKNDCADVSITSAPGENYSNKVFKLIQANYGTHKIYNSIFRDSMSQFLPGVNQYFRPAGAVMWFTDDKAAAYRKAKLNFALMSYRYILDRAVYKDPSTMFCLSNYSSAFMEMGNSLSNGGREQESIGYFKRAILLANKHTVAQAYTFLGIAYAKMNRMEEAKQAYEDSIKLNPTVEAYANLAGVYNSIKQYDLAIETVNLGLKLKPDFAEAYNNLAIAHYYKGDLNAAVRAMEKALTINPNNEMIRQNLEVLKKEASGK